MIEGLERWRGFLLAYRDWARTGDPIPARRYFDPLTEEPGNVGLFARIAMGDVEAGAGRTEHLHPDVGVIDLDGRHAGRVAVRAGTLGITVHAELILFLDGVPHVFLDFGRLFLDQLLGVGGEAGPRVLVDRQERRRVTEAARVFAQSGAAIVAITDSPLSPLVELTDTWCEIEVPAVGPFDSSVPAVAVAELLVAHVANELHDEALACIDRTEALWEATGTFLNITTELTVDYASKTATSVNSGVTFKEGDWISLDGGTGEVFEGALGTVSADYDQQDDLKTVLGWADEIRRMQVWTNADKPEEAERARAYGAQGIGLCRTEHMFFEPDRILAVREMILAEDSEDRERALAAMSAGDEEAGRERAFREIVGDRLRWGLSAAGHLDSDIFRFFQRRRPRMPSSFLPR